MSGDGGKRDVGAKLHPSHKIGSDMLEGGPPLCLEQDLVVDPIRDGLLATAPKLLQFPVKPEVADLPSQFFLAPGDLDRALEGGNVTLLHGRARYTRNLVSVNKVTGLTGNKAPCHLPFMGRLKAKSEKKPRRTAKPGMDGRTLGERLVESRAAAGLTQPDVVARCRRIMGLQQDEKDLVTQQLLSELEQNKQSKSEYTPVIAEAIGVRGVWLQYGVGPKTISEALMQNWTEDDG